MNELIVKVENVNGVLVTTSNRVADELGVNHKDLLEKIDKYIVRFSSAESSAQFYIPGEYKALNGRTVRNYLITKKGVAQLIGGYSSAVSKAFDLNVAYINRFEEMENELKSQFKLPQTYLEALEALVEKEKSLLLATQTIKEQQPKVEYHDKVLNSESCYTTTQIAKELEMSARQLNIMLNHMGVQFKQSGQWMLTAEYQDKGYVKTRTHLLPNGDTKHSTVWTEKGRKFLLDLSEDF